MALARIDYMFRDIWNIPLLEKVLIERCNGKFPARKSIQTEFAHRGGKKGFSFNLMQ